MTHRNQTSLGDLISVLYDEFLAAYGDEDLAAVAAAATVNEWLANSARDSAPSRPIPHPGEAAA
jgi:hypothetical protein